MPTYSMILCMSENNIIGDKGRMPWDRKRGDYMRFAKITKGKTMIMGRTTYIDTVSRLKEKGWSETGEMGSDRKVIVLSYDKDLEVAKDAIVLTSIPETLKYCEKNLPNEEVIISGGASIFSQFLPFTDKIYLTILHTKAQGDTSFEIPNIKEWKEIEKESFPKDDRNEFDYTFLTLERIRN